jgi:hypothetical protein
MYGTRLVQYVTRLNSKHILGNLSVQCVRLLCRQREKKHMIITIQEKTKSQVNITYNFNLQLHSAEECAKWQPW